MPSSFTEALLILRWFSKDSFRKLLCHNDAGEKNSPKAISIEKSCAATGVGAGAGAGAASNIKTAAPSAAKSNVGIRSADTGVSGVGENAAVTTRAMRVMNNREQIMIRNFFTGETS